MTPPTSVTRLREKYAAAARAAAAGNVPDGGVDVISNCVINLSGDKDKVFAGVPRVLKPGGRFAVSDVIADDDMDEATRADMAAWTGCIAGALTRDQFERSLTAAGLKDIEITETHRVHEHAASAIIRARKPLAWRRGPRCHVNKRKSPA